jgi:1,4-alpha-glucan branching enzyme
MKRPGELAIVLHAHMPYVEGGGPWPPPAVAHYMEQHGCDFETALENTPNLPDHEGFGTWPFGEEWLWEAIATSYLPLRGVLGRAPITLSLTPVLCDQLEAPGSMKRCLTFLRETRTATHALDLAAARARGERAEAAELERSAGEYAVAADALEALGTDLLTALGARASWTSAATHAILPLLATDAAIALQLETGIEAHRRRCGEWLGGFWLPECAYAPWLDEPLATAGVRCACVELTNLFGPGDARHLRPLTTPAGLLLWPIDRQLIDLVWSADGYPSGGAYRDRHSLTDHGHHVRANDGSAYDRERAVAQARTDAHVFVRRARERLAGGGVCACAFDAELFGHWWYEGVDWLAAVIDEAERQGVPLAALDETREGHEPALVPAGLGAISWGDGGDLRTWSGLGAAELAWQARAAELSVLARGSRPPDRVLRELLALQASDWAFLHSRGLAGDYPRQRADGHMAELRRALGAPTTNAVGQQELRNLAPVLAGWEG